MNKKRESIRLFQSPFLESLTHVHPIIPLVIWAPIILFILWRSVSLYQLQVSTLIGLAFFGLLVWTLTEYLMHRFLFHLKSWGPISERILFLFHGIHHDDPEDATRLVMPPVVSLSLASFFYVLFVSLMGAAFGEACFAFFIIGYLCYDYIHFAAHHFNPTSRVGRYLKQNHMLHHYTMPEARWGVSSPLWDFILGTMEEAKVKGKEA